MKKVLYYVVVVLLHSPSSCQAIVAFNSRRKSKKHLLSFIWWCWKAVWKTPQHFSPVLTPHKWGNHYNCLFFSQGHWIRCSGWKHLYLIKESKSSSQCSKVCVAQAGPARGCTLEHAISCKISLCREKKPTAPWSPETWVKHSELSAHHVHRLHKGMTKLIY